MTHTTRAACALALLLAGCSKAPAPKPNLLGDATRSAGPIATINGKAGICVSDTAGGLQCGPSADGPWKAIGSVVEIPANAAKRSWIEEESERMKDPKYAAKVQSHWDGIHAAPREITSLKKRLAAQEKRIAELERNLGEAREVSAMDGLTLRVHNQTLSMMSDRITRLQEACK